MTTNGQSSNRSGFLIGSLPPFVARDFEAANRPGIPETPSGHQSRRTRRRSSSAGHTTHNVDSFAQNRLGQDAAVFGSYRTRTRSLARAESEKHQQHTQHMSLDAAVAQINANDRPVEAWKPSIVLGSPLWLQGEDLSAIEIADRKVAQTRLWVAHYQGVPYFVQKHEEAIGERLKLNEALEQNTKPRTALKSTHDRAIRDRLNILDILLQNSNFPPERQNIEAAMAGYQSGAIPYSDSYTLLWGGHIVDRCPDYVSFTNDRDIRLSRYATEYGPGWLWYEPPLSAGSSTMRGPAAAAKKGFCLESKASWRQATENMGHYTILMGFRRRKANVMRGGEKEEEEEGRGRGEGGGGGGGGGGGTKPKQPFPFPRQTIPQPDTSAQGKTIPDPDGPRIIYNMLLDSGATLPTLWESDLPALGIHPRQYAAQSGRRVHTADSTLVARVYELDVSLLGSTDDDNDIDGSGNTFSSKTEADHPNRSSRPAPPLSCTIPVLVFPGSPSRGDGTSTTTNTTTAGDPSPDAVPDRLSGLLPFHACYLSGAPGTFRLWMGDRRRDVLGTGRLPGMMRYGEILGKPSDHQHHQHPPLPSPPLLKGTRQNQNDLFLLRTPDRIIFEHEIPPDDANTDKSRMDDEDKASAAAVMVLRDEDAGNDGGMVFKRGPRGIDFDNHHAEGSGVEVWHVGGTNSRKKKHQRVATTTLDDDHSVRRRGSVAGERQTRKRIKIDYTGQSAVR
ncbi:hypothetical protein C7999DRAFT_15909 [Corynascus novoguineensis]|uniref:Uncharacterized protein n=1 Tax=Corynascus novoguineensis TaxID=1126955 RepID=A0AAN7CQE9_9PEZI|nr:hypothetical protein C7999DRAFT_15909 [Corynascus novoguineensis]